MTTKAEMLKDIEYTEAKLIDNNTVRYVCPNGDVVIRLHHTNILTFPKNGGIIFNTNGYRTITTKNRMNKWQTIGHIYQENHIWYIVVDGVRHLYYDGITFPGKENK